MEPFITGFMFAFGCGVFGICCFLIAHIMAAWENYSTRNYARNTFWHYLRGRA